jgi:hypothetical protein
MTIDGEETNLVLVGIEQAEDVAGGLEGWGHVRYLSRISAAMTGFNRITLSSSTNAWRAENMIVVMACGNECK